MHHKYGWVFNHIPGLVLGYNCKIEAKWANNQTENPAHYDIMLPRHHYKMIPPPDRGENCNVTRFSNRNFPSIFKDPAYSASQSIEFILSQLDIQEQKKGGD